MSISVSIVLCTVNPHRARLARTLGGIADQTLNPAEWELLIIDNGSTPALSLATLVPVPANMRILVEPTTGLTSARLLGLTSAKGKIIVFVDDDNVLDKDYLAEALRQFNSHPALGAIGGVVLADFEIAPAPWITEFSGLLAVQNHGPNPLIQSGGANADWPVFAPVGAGLCVLAKAALHYVSAVQSDPRRRLLDRRGASLASGGDNDLVFTVLHSGWDVGYLPSLKLHHIIPSNRLTPGYLARLNRGIQRTWVGVLALHGKCSWSAIPQWSVPYRMARAWWRCRAWRSPVHRIRWAGLRGRLEGQADLISSSGLHTG
ncbi:MAG: glycosyltransferase [Cephaloticoccus sp.]|nr:glycosyltransferase [Cephaloticoccus sp.]